MKNLKAMTAQCINELHAIGIKPNHVTSVTINTRATGRWGQCKRHNGYVYSINVAACLVDDNAPDSALHDTLVHELVHTCDGCFNHGSEWQTNINKYNRHYQTNIQRTASYVEKGFTSDPLHKEEHYKWLLKCTSCGSQWKYQRTSKIVQSAMHNNARCGCGCTKITVTEL